MCVHTFVPGRLYFVRPLKFDVFFESVKFFTTIPFSVPCVALECLPCVAVAMTIIAAAALLSIIVKSIFDEI